MNLKQLNFLTKQLEDLLNKDSKNENLIAPILTEVYAVNTVFLSYQSEYEKIEQANNQRLVRLSTASVQKLSLYAQEMQQKKHSINQQIINLQKNYHFEVEKGHLDLHAKMTSLNQQHNLKVKTNFNDTEKAQLEATNQIASLEAQISKLKKDFLTNANQTTTQIESQLEQSGAENLIKNKTFEEQVILLQTQLDSEIQTINNKITTHSKKFEENYLSIKNVYHQASVQFNKKIDELKIKRAVALGKLKQNYESQLPPINQKLNTLKHDYDNLKKQTSLELNNSLARHHHKLETIMRDYETLKEKIDSKTVELKSFFNDSLTTFLKHKKQELSLFEEQISNEDSLSFNKTISSFIKQQNREIKQFKLNIKSQTKKATTEQLRKLLLLEINFINQKKDWKIEHTILETDYKASLNNIDLQAQYRISIYETQLKAEFLKYEQQKNDLETSLLLEIAPLDTQLKIANATQEREINLLNNDSSYYLSSFSASEKLSTLNFAIKKSELSHNNTKENIYFTFLSSRITANLQLSLEKETVLKNNELNKLVTEIKSISLNQKLNSLNNRYQLLLDELTTGSQKTQNRLYLTLLLVHLQTVNDIKVKILKTEQLHCDSLTTHQEVFEQSLKKDFMNQCELDLVYAKIKQLFKQLHSLHSLKKLYSKTLPHFYKEANNTDDFISFLKLSNTFDKIIQQLQLTVIEQFYDYIQNYYEQKIRELTGDNFDSSSTVLNNKFEIEQAKLESQKTNLLSEIRHYENQIIITTAKIENLEAKNKVLSHSLSTKLSQSLRRSVKIEIKKSHPEIIVLKKTIKTLNGQVSLISKSADILEAQLATLKLNYYREIDKLRTLQRKDAKIYFKHLSLYQSILERFNFTIKNYYSDTSGSTTLLLEHPYISIDMIQLYLAQEQKLNDEFQNKSLDIYQNLLDTSLSLFNLVSEKHNHVMNNLSYQQQNLLIQFEQKQKDSQIKIKNLIRQFENDTQELSITSNTQLQEQKESLANKELPAIHQLELEISLLQKQMLDGNKTTSTELSLITENLESIQQQYQSDYDQANLNNDLTYKADLSNNKRLINTNNQQIIEYEKNIHIKNDHLLNKFNENIKSFQQKLANDQLKYQNDIKMNLIALKIKLDDFENHSKLNQKHLKLKLKENNRNLKLAHSLIIKKETKSAKTTISDARQILNSK